MIQTLKDKESYDYAQLYLKSEPFCVEYLNM